MLLVQMPAVAVLRQEGGEKVTCVVETGSIPLK